MQKTLAQPNLSKVETKITLNGDKSQKSLTKIFEKIFVGKNGTKTNVFLCCEKGITLVWSEKPCFENYVEMVAGLPRNEQNK